MGVLLLLLFVALARPEPSSPVRVATDGDRPPPAEEGVAPADESTTTTAVPGTTTTTRPPVPRRIGVPPSSNDDDEPVASVSTPESREFPATPAYGVAHPLLRDQEGDGWVTTGPSTSESDPTIDLTRLDVIADDFSVTTELRVLDLDRAPVSSFPGPTAKQRYQMTLKRERGHFSFYLVRSATDGTFAVTGTYWRPEAGNADNAAMIGFDVAGVEGSVHVQSGIVRVTATFAEMNRAMVAAGSTASPTGRGTTVVPLGYAQTVTDQMMSTGSGDAVQSSDPAFAYRLGD